MEDAYFIIRNNEEKGLFSLHELIALPLLPDDLVWISGKSISWQFPSEIDALKPYLKKTPPPEKVKVFSLAPHQIFSSGTLVPKTYVYVQVPQKNINSAEESEEKEEELNAEKLQQKAEEIYQRVMVFEKRKEEEKESSGESSLQQMKEEFRKWQDKRARQKKLSYKLRWAIAGGFTGIAATGFFITTYNSPSVVNTSLPLENYKTQKVISPEPTVTKDPVQTVSYTVTEPVTKKENYTPAPSSVDEFIDSVENVLAKHDKHYKKNKVRSEMRNKQ